MSESVWLTRIVPVQEPDQGWHKDYDVEGFMVGRCQYPPAVAVSLFLEDMTAECGPTEIIPGSHRDPGLSPYRGATRQMMCPRRQDAVIWDQRLWHRGTQRTAGSRRLHVLYTFYPSQLMEATTQRMTAAQSRAWREATDPQDRIFFGGIFAHPDQ